MTQAFPHVFKIRNKKFMTNICCIISPLLHLQNVINHLQATKHLLSLQHLYFLKCYFKFLFIRYLGSFTKNSSKISIIESNITCYQKVIFQKRCFNSNYYQQQKVNKHLISLSVTLNLIHSQNLANFMEKTVSHYNLQYYCLLLLRPIFFHTFISFLYFLFGKTLSPYR